MEVDAMSTEKQMMLMKKGTCFICEGVGHRASDQKPGGSHDDRRKGKSTPRKNISEIHAFIQELTKDETDELLALQKKENKEENSDF